MQWLIKWMNHHNLPSPAPTVEINTCAPEQRVIDTRGQTSTTVDTLDTQSTAISIPQYPTTALNEDQFTTTVEQPPLSIAFQLPASNKIFPMTNFAHAISRPACDQDARDQVGNLARTYNPETHKPDNNNRHLNLTPEGEPLTYSRAKAGPESENWFIAEGEELNRLIESNTLRAIDHSTQPPNRRKDTTYYNPQTKEKIADNGTKTYRIRGTAGGDRIHYPDEVSARTADMEVVKLFIHSVCSDKVHSGQSCHWMTIDVKDFYLGSPLERPEYVRIPVKFIPLTVIKTHNLSQLIHNDAILFEIKKCMYGLPQAGLLSQRRLVAHLESHGYRQHPNVPCLFKHDTRGTTFTLVVDDFGIKYKSKDDDLHLINALENVYKLTGLDGLKIPRTLNIIFNQISKLSL